MPQFEIIELEEVDSTNRVAAETGRPWQVITADRQTAGRGRLNHRWLAPPGVNLAMSVVLPVEGLSMDTIVTLPLVVGHAVIKAVEDFLNRSADCRVPMLKWPNDILIDGLKVCGILCERRGDNVIAGIGVNVLPREFPPEIASTATSLFVGETEFSRVAEVRNAILARLAEDYCEVQRGGFAAIFSQLEAVDYLKGRTLAVLQTDDDQVPIRGICGGIAPDGSLEVGGRLVYAGEAHILKEGLRD